MIEIDALNAAIVAWRDGGEPADESTLAMLRHAQWAGGGGGSRGPPLHKVFQLRDARAAGVFTARLKDLQLQAGEARLPFEVRGEGAAAVRVATRRGAAHAPLRRADVEAALAVDTLAAEMQLAGNPKWA